jgi:hypothetical protein
MWDGFSERRKPNIRVARSSSTPFDRLNTSEFSYISATHFHKLGPSCLLNYGRATPLISPATSIPYNTVVSHGRHPPFHP